MATQQNAPSRSVIVAALLLLIAVAAFGAAFYFFDGMTYVDSLLSGELIASLIENEPPIAPPPSPAPEKLLLPDGMSESFALRLWQEQVESQSMIGRLVAGEVRELRIESTDVEGDTAILNSTVVFSDGTDAAGVIGMRRFGDQWYVAFASADRGGESGGVPDSELPDVDEVDVALLNTILAEQSKSASITAEYAEGKVESVAVEGVRPGPGTVTIGLEMDEDHEYSSADLIALERVVDGKTIWFLARFNKTGSRSL